MTTKTDEQERKAFEAWLRSKWTGGYGCAKYDDGSYVDPIAQLLWESRQDGRAALQSQPRTEPSEWLKQHEALMHRVSKAAMVVGYGGSINGADPEIALQRAERLLLDHARRRIEEEGE